MHCSGARYSSITTGKVPYLFELTVYWREIVNKQKRKQVRKMSEYGKCFMEN